LRECLWVREPPAIDSANIRIAGTSRPSLIGTVNESWRFLAIAEDSMDVIDSGE
jgi:hypothetical protein